MVLEFVSSLKQVLQPHHFVIDCAVSKLHYRFTVGLIFLFCILVTSRQYFGDPIACMGATSVEVPQAVLDTYCWIQATYTLPIAYDTKVGIKGVPHPGITANEDAERLYHNYYQWVWFVLLLQALFFYLPRYMWQTLESRSVKKLILDLNIPVPSDEKKREADCAVLAAYLKTTKGYHLGYALKFGFCEVLYLVNVVVQIFAIDAFLGGQFSRYGIEVVKFSEMDQVNRTDPMIKVFPRLTKCLFHKYGPSGSVQRHDSLCVLPLNIVNEKIFLVMWFWFIILAVITSLWLIWLVILMFLWRQGRFYIIKGAGKYAMTHELKEICKRTNYGDWILIYLLCLNMDGISFKKLIHNYYNLLESNSCDEKRNFSEA